MAACAALSCVLGTAVMYISGMRRPFKIHRTEAVQPRPIRAPAAWSFAARSAGFRATGSRTSRRSDARILLRSRAPGIPGDGHRMLTESHSAVDMAASD